MRAIQKFLSSIRSILGLATSVRSTASGVKREANYVSGAFKPKGKDPITN